MTKTKKLNLVDLDDAQLRELLPPNYDFNRDNLLSNGLRRMRWINYIRHNNPNMVKMQQTQKIQKSRKLKVPEPESKIEANVDETDEIIENIDNTVDKKLPKNYYFDNEKVEKLLQRYVDGACTDVVLRNEIMEHASELIRQIIRAHGLHNIYPGREDSSFFDLFQLAWCQIESTLYKYQKGRAKIFNMFSQVARTVILAHIKKEGRDKKNCKPYQDMLVRKHGTARSLMFDRFIEEAREICKFNEDHLIVLDALGRLFDVDHKPYDGLVSKLIKMSGRSRQHVVSFIETLRMRSSEFTDSPINDKPMPHPLVYQGVPDDED
jgi:hypothetical protein